MKSLQFLFLWNWTCCGTCHSRLVFCSDRVRYKTKWIANLVTNGWHLIITKYERNTLLGGKVLNALRGWLWDPGKISHYIQPVLSWGGALLCRGLHFRVGYTSVPWVPSNKRCYVKLSYSISFLHNCPWRNASRAEGQNTSETICDGRKASQPHPQPCH